MSSKLIRKLHRWLGLLFSISVLMASGSGVLHNIMTRTQAPPPQAKPSGGGMDVSAIKISVAEAVAKLGGNAEAQAVNLRGIGGQPWYQIYVKDAKGPHYVSAIDGRVDPVFRPIQRGIDRTIQLSADLERQLQGEAIEQGLQQALDPVHHDPPRRAFMRSIRAWKSLSSRPPLPWALGL